MTNRPDKWSTWPVEVRDLFDTLARGRETGDPERDAVRRLCELATQKDDRALSDAAFEAIDAATEIPEELLPKTSEERQRRQEWYRRSGRAQLDVAMLAELAETAPTQELRDSFKDLLVVYAPYAPHGKA